MSNSTNDAGNPNSLENNRNDDADRRKNRRISAFLWVILVLVIGALIGLVLFLLVEPYIVFTGPFGQLPPPSLVAYLLTFIAEHIILSTVGVALIVALIAVYLRTYLQTKANFALGLLIVFLALLLESILNYPLVEPFINNTALESTGFSSPIADVFKIAAFSIFLYLSLE